MPAPIIAIIDTHIDIAHPALRTTTGRTRLISLWDQAAPHDPARAPHPIALGVEHTAPRINRALARAHPRPRTSHGTHVAAIAATLAPSADLIFVRLHPHAQRRGSLHTSAPLIAALEHCFARATDLHRPCVINISLGTHLGPHDGSSPFDLALTRLLTTPRRAVVIAAGNAANLAAHTSALIPPGHAHTFTWLIPPSPPRAHAQPAAPTHHHLEVWFDAPASLRAHVDPPRPALHAPPLIHHHPGAQGRAACISIAIPSAAPHGSWHITLHNTSAHPARIDAWIERRAPYPQSRIHLRHADPARTLGSLSCAPCAIVVAAADVTQPHQPAAPFSSLGPTRDHRHKPDLAAPGVRITIPSHHATHPLYSARTPARSGTSFAAPHVAAAIAHAFEAHPAAPLTARHIRRALCSTADRTGHHTWRPQLGRGVLSTPAFLRRISTLAARLSTPLSPTPCLLKPP